MIFYAINTPSGLRPYDPERQLYVDAYERRHGALYMRNLQGEAIEVDAETFAKLAHDCMRGEPARAYAQAAGLRTAPRARGLADQPAEQTGEAGEAP